MIRTTNKKTNYKPLEALNATDGVYLVRWDYEELSYTDPETGEPVETGLAVWAEEILYREPTESGMRRMINDYYNNRTSYAILNGFSWEGQPVYLSDENQRNYKAAYDLAVQTGGVNLPVEFKFGTEERPVYRTFHTVEELQAFYLSMTEHINQCLTAGWRKKDAVDYTVYKVTQNKEE